MPRANNVPKPVQIVQAIQSLTNTDARSERSNRSTTSLTLKAQAVQIVQAVQSLRSVQNVQSRNAGAKKGFGLCVLDYMVTSNHIHLLVKDTGLNVIAQSMQLIAGRAK